MSVEKSQLRADIIFSFGQKADKVLEEAEKDVWRHEGATKALKQLGLNILGLQKLVDEDVDKGRYDLETATRIKDYLARTIAMVDGLGKAEWNRHLEAEGRRIASKEFVTLIEKEFTDAEAAVTRKKEALEAGEELSGRTPLPEGGGRTPAPNWEAQRASGTPKESEGPEASVTPRKGQERARRTARKPAAKKASKKKAATKRSVKKAANGEVRP